MGPIYKTAKPASSDVLSPSWLPFSKVSVTSPNGATNWGLTDRFHSNYNRRGSGLNEAALSPLWDGIIIAAEDQGEKLQLKGLPSLPHDGLWCQEGRLLQELTLCL